MDMPDREIVNLLKTAHEHLAKVRETALITWTRLHQNDLLKLCVGLLPDDLARAEEIAEDTLRKAVDEGHRIQDPENFSVFPWLIPTVSLDVVSLVASSCGYYRGQIGQRAAQ